MKTDNKKVIELFEKWYKDRDITNVMSKPWYFYKLPFEMQWGVWLKFFDENGIDVYTYPYYCWVKSSKDGYKYDVELVEDSYISASGKEEKIEQAQKAALEKALTILNDRL
jgi:hypothetical protein